MEETLFKKILVEKNDGEIVNIIDLPEEEYEKFLETMHKLRTAYIAITGRWNVG